MLKVRPWVSGRDRLRQVLVQEAILKSPEGFKLSSGGFSHYYVDCRRVLLSSWGVYLLSEVLLEEIAGLDIEAVGGPALGAVPMVFAVLAYTDLNGFIIRKRSKDHGAQRLIEGNIQPGQKVVLLDDVLTTGTSLRRAAEIAEDHGLEVERIVVLVSRDQKALDSLKRDYPVTAIYSLEELLQEVES